MVIHYIDIFSKKSETFVYKLIENLSQFSPQKVICFKRELEFERPYHDVFVAGESKNLIYRIYRRIFKRYYPFYPGKIISEIEKYKTKKFIAHFATNGIGLYKLLNKKLIEPNQLVIMCYGSDINRIKRHHFLTKIMLRKISKDSRVLFVAVSNFIKNKMIALGIEENRIEVIYPLSNGLPGDVKLKKSPPLEFISVGRLSPEKGFKFLIDAFELLEKEYPNCRLKIIGDGPQKFYLSDYLSTKNLNIELVGYVSYQKVKKYMEQADVYIQPSVVLRDGTEEGVSVSLIEAISKGLPCIVSEIGGMIEVVDHNKNGFYVRQKKSIDIYRAMKKYIENINLVNEHSKNSLEKSEKYFSEASIMKKWKEILN